MCKNKKGDNLNSNAQNKGRFITMPMWEEAGDFGCVAKPGDYVEESIVLEFLNCVPPATNSCDLVQCGEPYSHMLNLKTQKWSATYTTFAMDSQGWKYCGHCFLGEKENMERQD